METVKGQYVLVPDWKAEGDGCSWAFREKPEPLVVGPMTAEKREELIRKHEAKENWAIPLPLLARVKVDLSGPKTKIIHKKEYKIWG